MPQFSGLCAASSALVLVVVGNETTIMPQMVWLVMVKRIEKKLSDRKDLARYWIWTSRRRRPCGSSQKPSWISLVEPKEISCQAQSEDFEAWTW